MILTEGTSETEKIRTGLNPLSGGVAEPGRVSSIFLGWIPRCSPSNSTTSRQLVYQLSVDSHQQSRYLYQLQQELPWFSPI